MGFRIFLRRNHRWFSRFPSFLVIIRAFPEKLPRLCKKLPRFSENLRHFFQNFPRFSRKLPRFSENLRHFFQNFPRFSRKLPRFSENLRHFFQNFPRFSGKLPSFSKSSPYPSTKKSKFGEKYSQDRRTPFLLPLYFLGPLCFTRQSVKVVKAKSAKFLYVRARERVRDFIRMPSLIRMSSLPTLFGCASRETERGITISVL